MALSERPRGEQPTTRSLAESIRRGERRALARAITLVESTRPDHREAAAALLAELADPSRETVRIGLSGTPGVGKSTFVEAFGMRLIGEGRRVAVLAVDPSSTVAGGAILGDKTRMDRLVREANAFIRPSPSGGSLGGVSRRTREAILLVEAAGFDTVIVETVGVGQSETAVADLTDHFLLLLAPAGGDELQGVKRGVMEMADLVVVNKADGDLKTQAERTRADYAAALRLFRPRAEEVEGFPHALTVSAVEETGLDEVGEALERLDSIRRSTGALDRRRRRQTLAWLEQAIGERLSDAFRAAAGEQLEALRRQVAAGRTTPDAAARQAVAAVLPQG